LVGSLGSIYLPLEQLVREHLTLSEFCFPLSNFWRWFSFSKDIPNALFAQVFPQQSKIFPSASLYFGRRQKILEHIPTVLIAIDLAADAQVLPQYGCVYTYTSFRQLDRAQMLLNNNIYLNLLYLLLAINIIMIKM
jgi:hypothetical protein